MRIMVTGGAGFIGTNMVQFLLGNEPAENGVRIERVLTLDKLTYAGNRENLAEIETDPRFVFVQGDIIDADLVGSLLREHRMEAVIHLAAESHVDRSIAAPEAFVMTNVVGTFQLLEQARRYWSDPNNGISDPRFLYVSTDEVYGSLDPGASAFSEASPFLPNSPYSASKAGGDHLVRAYHQTYGLPVITSRCSNNYGPYQNPEKLIPLMIQRLLNHQPVPIYGDGLQTRDWLYVEDHCRALFAALCRGELGASYVIGGRCELRNIDVAKQVVQCLRELAPQRLAQAEDGWITHVEDRLGHDRRYAIDPGRIERELAWKPREDFQTGLRRTVAWYLERFAARD